MASYLVWVHLREVLDPDDVVVLRAAAALGARSRYRLAEAHRILLLDELRRTFPASATSERAVEQVARSAMDVASQCLVEELVLDRVDRARIDRFLRLEAEEHLDRAVEAGRGVVLMFAHAGATRLLEHRLALSGRDYVRGHVGDAPSADADAGSWFARRAAAARAGASGSLGSPTLDIEADPERAAEVLAGGGILGLALDGRAGRRFRGVRYLGRPALLDSAPWELAGRTGAPVVVATCIRTSDRSHRVLFAPPVAPDAQLGPADRCEDLLTRALREHVEPALRDHPDHYGRWLVHCRLHPEDGRHPLFVDPADPRWRTHEGMPWAA